MAVRDGRRSSRDSHEIADQQHPRGEGRTDEARARAQAALDGGGVPPGDLKAVQAVLGIAAAEPEETEPK